MKTIKDFDFTGKRVLLRLDLDVPLLDGEVRDDFRLRKALPTIMHLHKYKQLIIIGHLGRPEDVDESKSLKPVAEKLSHLLGEEIIFVEDYGNIPDKKIVLLENLRFHKGEYENNEEFAKNLASKADIFVNEAFASHQAHASTVGIPKYLPGCIGMQYEQELKYLKLENPKKPLVAILGGAKLNTKLPVIKNLLNKVDYILLGGAMIFTFYKAKGLEIGKSLFQKEYLKEAKKLLKNEKIILPTDVVVATSPEEESSIVNAQSIPKEAIGLDIGPTSIENFKKILEKARTIVWNGPLGYYEKDPFAKATKELAAFISNLECVKIVGGGDTVSVVNELNLSHDYTHVSTGGGSSLKLLEGKELEPLKALE